MQPIHVIGGGLAGCEAAWQAAEAGAPVVLHEMRPHRGTEAHLTDRAGRAGLLQLASLGRPGDQRGRAAARRKCGAAGSLIMRAADAHQVPAGGALAVDRDGLRRRRPGGDRGAPADHDRARRGRRSAARADWDNVGHRHRPPHLPGSAEAIRELTGEQSLAFFDAIAPIVHREIDRLRHRLVRSRATTRSAPAATAPTTSTAR